MLSSVLAYGFDPSPSSCWVTLEVPMADLSYSVTQRWYHSSGASSAAVGPGWLLLSMLDG